jgi:hypothetical protein
MFQNKFTSIIIIFVTVSFPKGFVVDVFAFLDEQVFNVQIEVFIS